MTATMAAMDQASATGCGKIILLGEHSVVYGHPALAAGLPHGASARANPSSETKLRVAPWGVELRPTDDVPLARALGVLLEQAGVAGAFTIDATVELPSGAGLGSSAALGVAVLRALDRARGVTRDADSELAISMAWERVFHGNPSGIDNAMAIAGGLAWYVRDEPLIRVHAKSPIHLVVGDSAEACSTKTTVESIARQREQNPDKINRTLEAIAAIVRNGRLALESGDQVALGQLFDMNQSLLASMLISTSTLEEMIAIAREAGALGAKLTGGGGGGCMIALANDADGAERIREALQGLGKNAFIAKIGERV